MKKLLFLILLFLTALSLSAAPTSCGGIYYRNTAPDIINTKLLPKTTEICYEQFAIMHSGLTKTPLWSAEHLTRDMLTKKAKRGDDFMKMLIFDLMREPNSQIMHIQAMTEVT